ncbi:hypothetical protein J5N97_019052 [Dioscorea zingiberensis]|uniref:F-box protein n=1 Tax=Dioscorea zingiberensis TaxID=325984 RepID=A0A9D5CE67_9LILI|nr:hypothetical protein J5N97_019052 [Dioscorea zingiberensis]
MVRLPGELCLKIFHFLDHQTLATSIQVCRKWKALASDDSLWYGLFMKRWGEDSASFYAPQGTKSWKDVYIVQDRCDRYGVGLKIIREGSDYYLIHQGEIERYLGGSSVRDGNGGQQQCLESGISDRILFLIGDLEVACADAKRIRM